MAVRVIRENNRSEGRTPKTGVTIIQGQVLLFDDSTHVKPYDDATFAAVPYGVAAESTGQLPIAPANGMTVGQGYDYTNFARGGLVSCWINGSELELYDDGHGLPYETGDGSYALNAPVYAKENGNVTPAVGTGRQKVGSVVDFDTAASPKRLRIKFDL